MTSAPGAATPSFPLVNEGTDWRGVRRFCSAAIITSTWMAQVPPTITIRIRKRRWYGARARPFQPSDAFSSTLMLVRSCAEVEEHPNANPTKPKSRRTFVDRTSFSFIQFKMFSCLNTKEGNLYPMPRLRFRVMHSHLSLEPIYILPRSSDLPQQWLPHVIAAVQVRLRRPRER